MSEVCLFFALGFALIMPRMVILACCGEKFMIFENRAIEKNAKLHSPPLRENYAALSGIHISITGIELAT